VPSKLKDTQNGKGAVHSFTETFKSWVAEAKVNPKRLDALLEDSRGLTEQLLEESEQASRVRYFEQSVEQLLQSCFPTPSKSEAIGIQLWQGQSYELLGAWEKAFAAFQKAIDLCDSDALDSQKAKAHRGMGRIQMMQGGHVEALESQERSLRLYRDCGDQRGEAQAYNAIAYCHFETGSFDQATYYWAKTLELAQGLNDIQIIAQVNNNLGIVANVEGDWDKALAHYSTGLQHFEKIADTLGRGRTYHNMAKTYADSERWQEAGVCYEKSDELAKEVGDAHTRANIKLNRAELYISIGDSKLAESLCHRALQAYRRLGDHLGEADVFKLLGVIYRTRGDWLEAQPYFEKCILLTQKFKNPLCEAEAHFEYARMWRCKGNNRSAQKQYQLALNSFTQISAHKQVARVRHEMAQPTPLPSS
jgi:tetratricopeptide (TPR) repeat protein